MLQMMEEYSQRHAIEYFHYLEMIERNLPTIRSFSVLGSVSVATIQFRGPEPREVFHLMDASGLSLVHFAVIPVFHVVFHVVYNFVLFLPQMSAGNQLVGNLDSEDHPVVRDTVFVDPDIGPDPFLEDHLPFY
jgi:hypothetical protein